MTDTCRCNFAGNYEISQLPAVKKLEQKVLGCDYGGTSWTNSAQVDHIREALELKPGIRLLEVGAGSGWPGLKLGAMSNCDVTLLDIPLNALKQATARAAQDEISDRVQVVAGNGTALPFTDKSFDRISHSDVLCCLPEKREMLTECRRVLMDNGRMHFSVIRPAEDLPNDEYELAIDTGPPFVGIEGGYAGLLRTSRWEILDRFDVTPDYQVSLEALVVGLNSDSPALVEAFGVDGLSEARQHRQAQIDLIKRGILVREIYVCEPS
jgi:SAM-dependent methyltransferase